MRASQTYIDGNKGERLVVTYKKYENKLAIKIRSKNKLILNDYVGIDEINSLEMKLLKIMSVESKNKLLKLVL